MKKKSRLPDWFGRAPNLSHVFLLVAIVVLASSILTASNSLVACVGIAAAAINFAHERYIQHSTTAIQRAKTDITASVEQRIAQSLQTLADWRTEIETRVREAVQTSEVAAKLRNQRPGLVPR